MRRVLDNVAERARTTLARRDRMLARDLKQGALDRLDFPRRYYPLLRLGPWQVAILADLAERTEAAWRVGTTRQRRALDDHGVPWCPRNGDPVPMTRSEVSATSRALGSLEGLGLAVRIRRRGSARTRRARLTVGGWEVAERLLRRRFDAAP